MRGIVRLIELNRSKNMANEITIDLATEKDLTSIKPLLRELMDAMENTTGFDIEQFIQNCRVLIKDPAHYMLVARDKDSILGLVNFNTRKTIMHALPSGLIDELVVTRSSRGMGIGKLLIQAAISKCRELGCGEVEVSTEKSNIEARRFYKACGFEEDAVLMEIGLEE
jgi:GNAT superfamily N-acetyltransferase